jgi:hypothetical protein
MKTNLKKSWIGSVFLLSSVMLANARLGLSKAECDTLYKQDGQSFESSLAPGMALRYYQRFMRQWGGKQIPYVVAGAGGYANTERALHKVAKGPNTGALTLPFQTSVEGVTLAAYNDSEVGFLRFKITDSEITGEYYTMDFEGNPQGVRDSFGVPVTKV